MKEPVLTAAFEERFYKLWNDLFQEKADGFSWARRESLTHERGEIAGSLEALSEGDSPEECYARLVSILSELLDE